MAAVPHLVVAFCVALSTALAGCSGAGSEGGDAGPMEVLPGVLVAPGHGAVEGRVLTDDGTALQGVRVSVIGTAAFADTDARGGFLFPNLTAGPHRLQAQAAGFEPTVASVDVPDQNITQIEIRLVPLENVGAGGRPHIHDHWRGQAAVTMFDGTLDLSAPTTLAEQNDVVGFREAAAMLLRPNTDRSIPIYLPETHDDGRPNTVYPGTAEVRVTFEWDSGTTNLDELGLEYIPADTTSRTRLETQSSGESWSIPVNASMADDGHQLFTLWEFFLYPDNHILDSGTEYTPAVYLGEVDIRIEIIRGDGPPAEPAHMDRWQGRDSLVLRDPDRQLVYAGNGISIISRYDRAKWFALDEDAVVPPGAERMRLEFTWDYESPVDAERFGDMTVIWKPAHLHPAHTSFTEFLDVEPIEDEPGKRVYEFDLDKDWTDAFYQDKTLWGWLPASEEDRDPPSYRAMGTMTFTLGVTVSR